MTPEILSLQRFPLKGSRARGETSLYLNTRVGVVGDRNLGIRSKPGDLTRRPEKLNKADFHVCANTPAIASQYLDFLVDGPRGREVNEDSYQDFLARIGVDHPAQLQDTRGEYHLCDTEGAQVSILNLATVRALEEASGLVIDPDRFRANIWITGLPAFEEYEWINGYPGTLEFMAGEIRLRGDDATERCKAPDANPLTGEYDMDVSAAIWKLMKARGYRSPHRKTPIVMGIYGVVLNDGVINVGDKIQLL
jgi:uncharacterized protein YcbX